MQIFYPFNKKNSYSPFKYCSICAQTMTSSWINANEHNPSFHCVVKHWVDDVIKLNSLSQNVL